MDGGGTVLCLTVMDRSLEKEIAHCTLKSYLEFCKRVGAEGGNRWSDATSAVLRMLF